VQLRKAVKKALQRVALLAAIVGSTANRQNHQNPQSIVSGAVIKPLGSRPSPRRPSAGLSHAVPAFSLLAKAAITTTLRLNQWFFSCAAGALAEMKLLKK